MHWKKKNQRDLAHHSSEILVKLQPTHMQAKGIFFFFFLQMNLMLVLFLGQTAALGHL